jgi:hypothetical protein
VVAFDPVADDVCECEEDEVDAELFFKDAGSFSVAFFPGIGFMFPFVEEVHIAIADCVWALLVFYLVLLSSLLWFARE